MNILITGANGFVGKNLTVTLANIREGKDRTRPSTKIEELYLYDIATSKEVLDEACENVDFVFHLAGVNRPKNPSEFMEGNYGFTKTLLNTLKKYNNSCPVMISSSIQATCIGQYDGEYPGHWDGRVTAKKISISRGYAAEIYGETDSGEVKL